MTDHMDLPLDPPEPRRKPPKGTQPLYREPGDDGWYDHTHTEMLLAEYDAELARLAATRDGMLEVVGDDTGMAGAE